MVSEPNIRVVGEGGWFRYKKSDASIMHTGHRTGITGTGAEEGFVWVRVQDLVVYSCYLSPDIDLGDYRSFLNNLANDLVEKGTLNVILTGDFNARSCMGDASGG